MGEAQDQQLDLPIRPDRFPFFARTRAIAVKRVEVLAAYDGSTDLVASLTPSGLPAETLTVRRDAVVGTLHHATRDIDVPVGAGSAPWTLKLKEAAATDFHALPPEKLDELFVVLHFEVH